MVRIWCFHCGGQGSIACQGTIPQPACCCRNLSFCTVPNINTETEFRRKEKNVALFLCLAKWGHSGLAPPKTVRPTLGNRRRFYTWGWKSGVYDKDQSSEGLAFFFSLHYFKTVIAGVRQPSNWGPAAWKLDPFVSGLSTCNLLSEMQKLQGVICYKGAWGIYMKLGSDMCRM